MIKIFGEPNIEEIKRVAQQILKELEVEKNGGSLERH